MVPLVERVASSLYSRVQSNCRPCLQFALWAPSRTATSNHDGSISIDMTNRDDTNEGEQDHPFSPVDGAAGHREQSQSDRRSPAQERRSSDRRPRSILRSSSTVSSNSASSSSSSRHVNPRVVRQRQPRRRHLVSFNARDEIFFIPSRRQLREEQQEAARTQQIRRSLTMRRPNLVAQRVRIRRPSRAPRQARRRTRNARGSRRRTATSPRRRVNRLGRARRRYMRSQRRPRATAREASVSESNSDQENRQVAMKGVTVSRGRRRRRRSNQRTRRRRIASPPPEDDET